jgi:hypothetical protein
MNGFGSGRELWIVTLIKSAVEQHRCVEIEVAGAKRAVCPHALGHKDGKRRVLVYQFGGPSASGLAHAGAWRSFALDEITAAHIIAGGWHSQHDFIAKVETWFDHIECQARPL